MAIGFAVFFTLVGLRISLWYLFRGNSKRLNATLKVAQDKSLDWVELSFKKIPTPNEKGNGGN